MTEVKCSMCIKKINKNEGLIPAKCLMENGKSAHRICSNCWWDPLKGFALEYRSHRCPGCQKGLLLTEYKKDGPIFVDLTKD